ncbi:MAG: HIT family protein [Candidatus Thermoplasmatota archaeon]|nr:HIT family protein [Candidatus Thermoplasmatota archaeon]MDA8144315.1 HIT family protein [Thermoplasmatales archaeon]
MFKNHCIFCNEIVRNRKASVIYESDKVLAFMDNAPVEPGHALVIPKEHYENILDIDYETYLEVHRVTKALSPPIIRAVSAEGINIGQNNGACANQKVFHYHVHIIPRFPDRELKWGRRIALDHELDRVAARIREEIQNHDGDIPVLK